MSGIADGYTRRVAKVMISVPDDALERIDAAAKRRGTSRSALVVDAALRAIDLPTAEDAERFMAATRDRWAGVPSPLESGAWIRADRDARDARDRLRP